MPLLLFGSDPKIFYNFASGSLPTGVTFARASTATYTNSSGVITSSAINAPRFDYDARTLGFRGLLIEDQRTNKVTNSIIDASNTGWNEVNITRGGTVAAPDGTTTGRIIDDKVTSTAYHANLANTASFNAGDILTSSLYVKAGTSYICQIYGSTAIFDSQTVANFNLTTGEVVKSNLGTASIEQAGEGYYRCIFTATCTKTSTTGRTCDIIFTNNDPNAGTLPNYTATGINMSMWGAQGELGSTVSTYIPTTGSTVTRAQDQLSFTIPTGVNALRYVFDNGTSQTVSVTAGAYTVPTNLNRPWIKMIISV